MDPITKIVAVIVFALAMLFIGPWIVQLLWNGCLVPAVDGVHEVTYWQAFGLSALSTLLFKNFSVGGK